MGRAFLRFPDFRKKVLTLSYDDGLKCDARLLEIMEAHGIKGTFNLNSGIMEVQPEDIYFGTEEAKRLYASENAEVAIHGVMHHSWGEISSSNLMDEILNDRKSLEKSFGVRVHGCAYPNGSYNDAAIEILRLCGIDYARTVVSTEKFDLPTDWLQMPATCHHNNPRLMELAKLFLEDEQAFSHWWDMPKMFCLWGHSYEFDQHGNWNVIEEFAELVGDRCDVWYATIGEIFDYVKAFDSLIYGLNRDYIYNPTAINVWISYYGKNILVESGKMVRL